MNSDQTQHQSPNEKRKSRDLSLKPHHPPSEIPGYRLQHFLGNGAYGEVWSATNQNTGRRVAVKFYTGSSRSDIQLLVREVEKLVVLAADRYVVQLLDVGWDAQPPYYVMDYIEQGSLEDRLNQSEPIPVAEAVELFQEVATGMMHLHGKGILHCDLKPGNVLLDQDGNPRVADFGQSRLSSEQSSALGTLFFMAPEQADMSAAPDARWDVYGLGAMLYSMLTGKPPYYSVELASQIESIPDIDERLKKYREELQRADRPKAHRQVPGVDRMLAEIVDQCIAANPKERFGSIQSVLFALRQREATRSRRPLMVLGLLGPLLLMGVMALFSWWAFNQSVGDTKLEITRKANESNLFAARFAARSAAEQIDEYLRVVGQLARDTEFISAFREFDSDPKLVQIRGRLADINNNNPNSGDSEINALRVEFEANPIRRKLDPFLRKRMEEQNGEYPHAASWFINDRAGNQVASVFEQIPGEPTSNTLGMNWSYRTYFSGLDRDLKSKVNGEDVYDVHGDVESRVIIQGPHICAIFLSKASNTWKIAFSTPIIIDDQIRGVVAVTSDVGDFVEFVDEEGGQYAILVDDRPGDNKGVVLEHPLFDEYKQLRIPDSLTHRVVDISSLDDNSIFFDPVGKDDAGKNGYSNSSVAAKASVTTKWFKSNSKTGETPSGRVDTGLYVVAIKDYQSIVEPAHVLGQRLGRLAATAAAFFALVTLGMWLLVARMLRDSRKRLDRSFSPISESANLEGAYTAVTSRSSSHPTEDQ